MRTTLSFAIVHVNGEAVYTGGMAQPVITPAQARMARAALRLGVRDVSAASGISAATIVRVERETVASNVGTLATLRTTFEGLGIVFVGDYGVNLRATTPVVKKPAAKT
jgi:transcriptional regulator with XRE-family HTH domain